MFAYKIYQLQSQPYELWDCCACREPGRVCMDAAVGHTEQGLRSCWPSKCCEMLGASTFCCAGAGGDMCYKTPKNSFHLKFTPVWKILSCISLSLFSFAFAPLLIPINCLEPYLQTPVSSTQTSLFSFRVDINT